MVMRKQVRRCAMQDCVDKTLGRFCAIGLVLVRRAVRGSASLLLCDRELWTRSCSLFLTQKDKGTMGDQMEGPVEPPWIVLVVYLRSRTNYLEVRVEVCVCVRVHPPPTFRLVGALLCSALFLGGGPRRLLPPDSKYAGSWACLVTHELPTFGMVGSQCVKAGAMSSQWSMQPGRQTRRRPPSYQPAFSWDWRGQYCALVVRVGAVVVLGILYLLGFRRRCSPGEPAGVATGPHTRDKTGRKPLDETISCGLINSYTLVELLGARSQELDSQQSLVMTTFASTRLSKSHGRADQ